MSNLTNINWDWLFWIFGGTLAIAGLGLLYWAMLADRFGFPGLMRAGGRRRRCPKCWYDMSATVGLVCSECGRQVKRERKLFKTRRRWGWGLLAMLMLALAAGSAMTPSIKRDGWAKHVPTTILIALTPKLLDQDGHDELLRRLQENTLWSWQWMWLINRNNSTSAPLWNLSVTTRDRWPEHVPLCADVALKFGPILMGWFDGPTVRARLLPTFDPAAEPIEFATSLWFAPPPTAIYERARRLGMPAAGVREVRLDFVIEILAGSGKGKKVISSDRWNVIHRETVRLPVTIGGKLEEFIDPDPSQDLVDFIQKRADFELHGSYLDFQDHFHPPTPDGLTCPVTVELLRNGKRMTSWPDWWMTGKRPPAYLPGPDTILVGHWLGVPSSLKGDERPFGTVHYREFTWSLRVRGDPGRALLDKQAKRCWTGEFDVPLHLVDKPGELVFRSRDDHDDDKAKDEPDVQHN